MFGQSRDFFSCRFNTIWICDVELDESGACSLFLQGGGGFRPGLLLSCRKENVKAFAGELTTNFEPDSFIGACDQCCFLSNHIALPEAARLTFIIHRDSERSIHCSQALDYAAPHAAVVGDKTTDDVRQC